MTASELAGVIAAHAIWCVSDAESFTPMFAFTTEDGQRELERLAGEDMAASVEFGRQRLEHDPPGAIDGVLAYDGRITVGEDKLDAVILEMRSYGFPWAKATIAVPYTPRRSGRFLVHKPKLVQWDGCADFDMGAAIEAFFRGIGTHERGAQVWNAALDESE